LNRDEYRISTVLDPRYGFGSILEDQRAPVKLRLKKLITIEKRKRDISEIRPTKENATASTKSLELIDKRKSNYMFVPAASVSNITDRQIDDSIDILIEKYIREVEEPLNEHLKTDCPLLFWSSHSGNHEFREMAQLAKRFLSIQASSACCERLFSISGHIFQEKRRRLGEIFFSRLVFLKLNERYF
jgi:hypothetical protein